jgi:hypothetical protein
LPRPAIKATRLFCLHYSINATAMKKYAAFMALLGWFALIAQFCLNLGNGLASTQELVIRFFTFFTITTNLLIAISYTYILFQPISFGAGFFSRPGTQTALAVYIMIVGLIYNLILRFLWSPQGLQRIVDELLHLVIPLLYFIYWVAFVPKGQLKYRLIWGWLIYPLVYIVVILIRGNISGYYPYPFLDIGKLGKNAVMINCVGVTLMFVIISILLVFFGRWRSRRS